LARVRGKRKKDNTGAERTMRKLIYAINVTLDGCCDHTKSSPDEELMEYYIKLLREADLLVYGRKTYQLMVPYWPEIAKNPSETKADREFAQAFDACNIVVFSLSLERIEDGKTRIVRSDLREEILKLKEQPGKNILVGGVDLPSQLMQLGLIDEYRIVIAPIFAGKGRRLFEDVTLSENRHLKLVESKLSKSGSVALRYSKQ
jgi:dihydrofolate reductase